ncbi:hypothetical protein MAR_017501 [Mya arenaria]|uniref:Uncharacterized protein n=1 Tax=Mya arenaria TaxID=6604 RepID=A0ABY7EBZ9_MYAAR|nr:hypothetical protein MAR_017501 [Mya arenaria]
MEKDETLRHKRKSIIEILRSYLHQEVSFLIYEPFGNVVLNYSIGNEAISDTEMCLLKALLGERRGQSFQIKIFGSKYQTVLSPGGLLIGRGPDSDLGTRRVQLPVPIIKIGHTEETLEHTKIGGKRDSSNLLAILDLQDKIKVQQPACNTIFARKDDSPATSFSLERKIRYIGRRSTQQVDTPLAEQGEEGMSTFSDDRRPIKQIILYKRQSQLELTVFMLTASDTGNDLLPVKVAVPVGVCLFVAVVFTVFLLKRRSKRQSAKDGKTVDVPTELNDIPDCGTITEKDASNIIDSDIDRSSTYDINPLYDSSNTENYYNHVRKNETDIFPEYSSADKRKQEHIETSNQYDYTTFNGVVGADNITQKSPSSQ